jgi:hypothetical protein
MKNSASELFRQQSGGYTVAFGYIRQLAVHLRASTKVKTKASLAVCYHYFYTGADPYLVKCRRRTNRSTIGSLFIVLIFGVWCLREGMKSYGLLYTHSYKLVWVLSGKRAVSDFLFSQRNQLGFISTYCFIFFSRQTCFCSHLQITFLQKLIPWSFYIV